jgi:probable F420-dependent oxidoreductase
MSSTNAVAAAREAMGPVGIFLPGPVLDGPVSAAESVESVQQLEAAGWRTAWNNEGVYDKDAFVHLALLLSNTERMVFGPSIANIWSRAPQVAGLAAAMLAEAFPGRFVLGMGVGYSMQADYVGQPWGHPLENMRDYLEKMQVPMGLRQVPDAEYATVIAARRPKMLALAGEISDGINSNGAPPEWTAHAREVLGPDKLVIIGVPTILDEDVERARATARANVPRIAPILQELGGISLSPEELAEPTDAVVDSLTAYGDPSHIADQVRAHLEAGADHVMIMLAGQNHTAGIQQALELAPALTAI